MNKLLLLAVFSALLFVVDAGYTRASIASTRSHPHEWVPTGRPHPNQVVQFDILLKRRNMNVIYDTFTAVSDPKNPRWGQYLTKTQLEHLVRPEQRVYDEFEAWLRPIAKQSHIVTSAHAIQVTTTVGVAERLFGTPFAVFEHAYGKHKPRVRIDGDVNLPAHLHKYVDLVAGLTEFLTDEIKGEYYTARSRNPTKLATNSITVTPSVLKSFYNVPSNLKVTNKLTSHGIAAFDDFFSNSALQYFCQNMSIQYPPNVTVVGPNCIAQQCDQTESDLDMEYITAMAPNTPTLFINQGVDYWILQWTLNILALSSSPNVFSISYGWSEIEQCDIAVINCPKFGYNTYTYVQRTNEELQQLGTLGISVLVADGDDGAPGLGGASGNCPIDASVYCPVGGCQHTSTQCPSLTITNTSSGLPCYFPMGIGSDACAGFLGKQALVERVLEAFFSANSKCKVTLDTDLEQLPHVYSTCSCNALTPITNSGFSVAGYVFNQKGGFVFSADYPTSSPFVTAVGATQLVGTNVKSLTEIGASILTGAIITTGGGFSSFQPAENYQAAALQNYANSGVTLPPSFTFNTSNRGYPDVAFCGHNYLIFQGKGQTCPPKGCPAIVVDGTSCSSPSFAGLISLINDHLFNNNKTAIGFLNPLLYQAAVDSPSVFNDVSSGNNRCNRAYCCLYGYNAAKGWDPVSGLGSPNWSNLVNYIANLKGIPGVADDVADN